MKRRAKFLVWLFVTAIVCATAKTGSSQSSDQSLPTPVLANEINGTINALDLGDPRLTRHFYAFDASPGDLIVTMEGKNLNGDIDVFTAVTLRPLMKTTMYANTQMPEVTKSIYLRAHQILILRVEARTPNDEAGSYHIRFRGTFEPFAGGIPVAETTESNSTSRATPGAKRVSSVGATIAEPPAETTAKAEPTPSPVSEPANVATETKSNEKPATMSEKKTEAPKSTSNKTPARSTARNNRRRAPTPKAPPPAKDSAKAPPPKEEKQPKSEPEKSKTSSEEAKTNEETAKTASTTTPVTPKPQEAPAPGARLIIEEKDGTKVDRPMTTIRRVVVEGNAIVIVMKNGHIERVPMSIVSRMAIEPQ